MCMKAPKMKSGGDVPAIPTAPIQEQLPQTQTGADTANKKKQAKPSSQSLFQIDLTIPTGGNMGDTTGAAVR